MVGRPSKKAKFSRYVDVNEACPAPAYNCFHSYGIQHNGKMSVDTTYMLSQPADEVPIPSSPILPSANDWNETIYQDPVISRIPDQHLTTFPRLIRTSGPPVHVSRPNPLSVRIPVLLHLISGRQI
ncbi:uncharacterized protein HD556DRAFT_1436336 [Suillus plorans]|uniref:Uncharacterized protein n=1 Tax=Suillus plorans TaxID=116603 RepID=A0A9P7J7B4_9AGAM|nr:uncharacterized protein HD556DRAFT_1436336 [Suillus plorans]KAG1806363.1 hypothetical protein HD556DRAFT_1436336 [Suillus plorans]